MFVVDSSSNDDDVDLAAAELKQALSHPSLETLPLLVLANKQDVQGARSADEVSNKSFSSWTSKCINCILLWGVFLVHPSLLKNQHFQIQIARFHSCGQHLCKFDRTKESVYINWKVQLWSTNMASVSLFWNAISELKQRRFWARHVNRKWFCPFFRTTCLYNS